jgi:serine/threonine protein kinase
MGVVYRALDIKLNRPVAIKFLSNELADAEARHRFQREAQMASSLNHPHILTVYDAGDFEGRQYLVTEFVDGGTLKTWAKQEKRTWRQIVELLTGVADGLAAAHQAGILHRDIKPDNVLYRKTATLSWPILVWRNWPKAPPPGRSDSHADRTSHPQGRHHWHHRLYVARAGLGQGLDACSDIFSFGVVLYEMFSGRRPFGGASDLEALKTIIHAPPEPLSHDVPAGLRTAIDKTLEKDPEERYQSMRDLVVDLRRVARNKVEEPPRTAAPQSRLRWLPWAALAAALAAFGLRGFALPTAPSENPVANTQFTRLTDFPGDELTLVFRRTASSSRFRGPRRPADIWLSRSAPGGSSI